MIYRATVVDADDPSESQSVRVKCQQLYGEGTSGWVSACVSASGAPPRPPEIGDTVWIALEGNDRDRPVWIGRWLTPGHTDELPDFSEVKSLTPSYRSAIHLLFAQNTGSVNYGNAASTSATGASLSLIEAAQNSPRCIRYTSSGSAGVAAGATSFSTFVCRGAATDWATAGFEFSTTVRLNDASYNNTTASTGSRIGVGVSSLVAAGDPATLLGNDNLSGSFVGFMRRSVNGGASDTYWTLASRNGTSLSTLATATVFNPQRWYTLSIGCKPGSASFYWEIIDRTTGIVDSGLWYPSYYPASSTMLGGFVAVQSVNATARTIDLNRWALVASK